MTTALSTEKNDSDNDETNDNDDSTETNDSDSDETNDNDDSEERFRQ